VSDGSFGSKNKRTVKELPLGQALGLLFKYPQERVDEMFHFEFDFRNEAVHFRPSLLKWLPEDVRLIRLANHASLMMDKRQREKGVIL
jgi:hypothetical protein